MSALHRVIIYQQEHSKKFIQGNNYKKWSIKKRVSDNNLTVNYDRCTLSRIVFPTVASWLQTDDSKGLVDRAGDNGPHPAAPSSNDTTA